MKKIYRFACAVPECRTADIVFNTSKIADLYCSAAANNAGVVLFPAYALSGYGCGQLSDFPLFISEENSALKQLAELTEKYPSVLVCGISEGKTAVISDGVVYYADSTDQIFTDGIMRFACASADRWNFDAVCNTGGAHAVLFPAAATDTFHTVKERRNEFCCLSRQLTAACFLCNAGAANSTAAGVCSGQALAAFDGKVTAETRHFSRDAQLIYYDTDTERIEYLRRRNMCFDGTSQEINIDIPAVEKSEYDDVTKYPFIPQDKTELQHYSRSIIEISACALANRMITSHSKKMVLGVSGGLDSTMALITCVECCKLLNRSNDAIVAVSMPGFGTSDRTRDNSLAIAGELKTELKYIPITEAVTQHFKDIGHDPENTDVVYENSQARERTQILMDIANQCGGIVIGTGDLSEIALGWCTYNGDQMSMYAVNASIPKTLMREVIRCYAGECGNETLADKLIDICDTPVSPELVPGKQFTEEIIGSYDLHDFFLYYLLKYGDSPEKLYNSCCKAFANIYTKEQISAAIEVFFRRFFISQFKRSAMPDAPDVTGISLSSFAMPSDAAGNLWFQAVSDLKKQL